MTCKVPLPSSWLREFLAETTAEYTCLRAFPQYLTLLFEVDGMFLNDDRHLKNIAVLEQGDGTAVAPYFTIFVYNANKRPPAGGRLFVGIYSSVADGVYGDRIIENIRDRAGQEGKT